jgi:hypothetical protein
MIKKAHMTTYVMSARPPKSIVLTMVRPRPPPDGWLNWWVRWTLSASEVIEAAACPVVRAEADELGERAECLLYDGHPGSHSFDLQRPGKPSYD